MKKESIKVGGLLGRGLFAGCLLAGFCSLVQAAAAEDLFVARGETVALAESKTYDAITVHGRLTVGGGATVGAATVALGPDAGDDAEIAVLDAQSCFGSKATKITVGASGGTGRLTGPSTGGGGYAFAYQTLEVSANATVNESGDIPVMSLGKGRTSGGTIANRHKTGTALVTADASACFGGGAYQYWGSPFFEGRIRVESQGDSTSSVSLYTHYAPRALVADGGSLAFSGFAEVKLEGNWNQADAGQYTLLNKAVTWGGAAVHVVGWFHQVKVKGEVKVAGLTMDKTCYVTGGEGAKLLVGDSEQETSLSGTFKSPVVVEKTGSGVTRVAATTVGTLAVSEGELKVEAALDAASLSVAEGATLRIVGATATVSGDSSVVGNLVTEDGGRLTVAVSADTNVRSAGGVRGTRFEKTGAGALTLENPAGLADDIHVAEGTLLFSGSGYSVPLYKFEGTAHKGSKSTAWGIGEFAFLDKDGLRVGVGITAKDPGTALADLPAGCATVPAGYKYSPWYWSVAELFDDKKNSMMGISSPTLAETNAVAFYVRLPESSPGIVGYNWAGTYDNGYPSSWTLFGSADNGETWVALDARTDYTLGNWAGVWAGGSGNVAVGSDAAVPMAFTLADKSGNPAFAAPGATGLPSSMKIEVDKGAVLDFTNVTGGQVVEALTLDAVNGGGEVRGARLAETGVLYLNNLPEGADIRTYRPSFEWTAVVGDLDFSRWQLVVDGKKTRHRIAWKNGAFRFSGSGFFLIVR